MTVKKLHLRIPGSTANLGPGFDTLGLALELYTDITFELLAEPDEAMSPVVCEGDIAQQLPADQSNLIYATISSLWNEQKDLLSRLRIRVATQIPLARGLGSSSTAVLGAVWAAQALAGNKVDKLSILRQAAGIEGHADNLAASLYGGLVACRQDDSGVTVQTLTWPAKWSTLVVVPPYPLSTQQARLVLPKTLSMADAVSNVQNVAVLMAAVANQDDQVLSRALSDKLHEPYRESLVPELPDLRRKLQDLPVLGCVLSGAGPSILVLVNQQHKPGISQCLKSWCQNQATGTQVLELNVDRQGVREVYGS